jgi:hypothetical protein
MSFLAPLFLLGALAVAAPLLFHLIRRTTRNVTPFSTLMFLQPTPPRVTRRSRLENLWLLLLRCLILALLALGFSRPFFRESAISAEPKSSASKRIVVLLDTSASMRRDGLWEAARASANAVLSEAAPEDEVALVAFDHTVRTLLTLDEWRGLPAADRGAVAAQRIATLNPGWGATQLDIALIRAAEMLEEPGDELPHRRSIVVISDLQEGSRLSAVQGYSWPADLQIVLQRVDAPQQQNTSLQWLAESSDEDRTSEAATLRVRVTAPQDTSREQFSLSWSGSPAAPPVEAYVPAGQSRIVNVPAPAGGGTLVLGGDEVPFDNTLFLLPPAAAAVRILYLGTDAEEDPRASLYYLHRAFPKTARQTVEIIPHRTAEAPPTELLGKAQLIVVGEGAGEAALIAARGFAAAGGIVLAPLASAESGSAVSHLLQLPAFTTPEAAVKDYALLARIDFEHPLFTPFADPRFSDFTKIHFWKYRRIDEATIPGARRLASFDSGDPALVQVPLERGSLLLLASSWRPADSQLALSSKFLPLLHATLEQSSRLPVQKSQYFVGDSVPLPESAPSFTIRRPDGAKVSVESGAQFTATDLPGIYSITPGGQQFVVNLSPEESRTRPLEQERFTSLALPLGETAATALRSGGIRPPAALPAETESRQKLWRWLVVAALFILLLETVVAGRLSRSVSPPAVAQP